jgi:hypothetical protein
MNNKQVLPTKEFYEFMKQRNETPVVMFQLITNNLLRKYFTLSYLVSQEYEYEVSPDDNTHPVVLEAWKKHRKGASVKKTLTQEEASIIREIFHTIQGQQEGK